MKFELTTRTSDTVLSRYKSSRARVAIITGPLGSGKTFGSCEKIFRLMCEQKPNRMGQRKTRFYAVRNTYPDLLSTTVKDWMELFGELGTFKGAGIEPPTHTLKFKLKDKTVVMSELVFIALDKPVAVKKLRGAQLTGGWLNEIKELNKSVIDMIDLRHGRYPSKMDGGPTWHGLIGDTNQCDDDHWLYVLAEETKPKNWEFFTQPGGVVREMAENEKGQQEWTGKWLLNDVAENLGNLPNDYYMQGLEGKSEEWIAVNLANEYGSTFDGKPIYASQWNEKIHSSDSIQLIEDHPICVGLDFGYRAPAAVIGQETPNGVINILDELVGEGMGIQQFVKTLLRPLLNKRYKDCEWNFVGDPAGNKHADTDEDTVFKKLDELGLTADAANTNDPVIRWDAVRIPLQELRDGVPAFQLHSRCKILRKGFNGGYHYRRILVAGEDKYADKPNKNKFSHPHDALQYLMLWYMGETVPTIGFTRPPAATAGWAS
jgi:hypothetical protein